MAVYHERGIIVASCECAIRPRPGPGRRGAWHAKQLPAILRDGLVSTFPQGRLFPPVFPCPAVISEMSLNLSLMSLSGVHQLLIAMTYEYTVFVKQKFQDFRVLPTWLIEDRLSPELPMIKLTTVRHQGGV